MRVIIDCDPGNGIAGANVDDGLALALAIAAPQISLEMITTVAGNTPSEVGYAVACDMVRQLDKTIPVWRGASRPLLEDPAPWRSRLDRGVDLNGLRYLWCGVPGPQPSPPSAPAAPSAIGELICSNPGEIILVATAPLTNIALALQLYPEIVSSVKRIIIMGGVFNVPGYIKDTNFGIDPEAAHAVLTSGAPITLVPMDVTTQTQMIHADLDRLVQVDNALSHYLEQTIRPWIHYSMQTRNLPGCWIHDALTIAFLLDPSLCSGSDEYVDVALHGITRGQSVRCNPENLRIDVGIPAQRGNPVHVLEKVDNQKLLALIEQYIYQYT